MLFDYSKLKVHRMICVDMKSFYASVEAVDHQLDPLQAMIAVVGDRHVSSSVVLAASPALKQRYQIRTGSRLFQIPRTNHIHVFESRMQRYLDVSMQIVRILNEFVPAEAIHIYSIDEMIVCLDSTTNSYPSAWEAAVDIKQTILKRTGITASIGIGPNKFISKVVLDTQAKHTGIAECRYEDVPELLWPLRVEEVWGIGEKMRRQFNRARIFTLKDLAYTSLGWLRRKYGVMGEEYYMHAWGVDLSPVHHDPTLEIRKGFSRGNTLARDYSISDAKIVIYEATDYLARKLRSAHLAARTVSLSLRYNRLDLLASYSRSVTLLSASDLSKYLYESCCLLLDQSTVDGRIRHVAVTVSNLVDDDEIQMDLFVHATDEKLRRLGKTMDAIQTKFGSAAILRASSISEAGTAIQRSHKIGGHYSG